MGVAGCAGDLFAGTHPMGANIAMWGVIEVKRGHPRLVIPGAMCSTQDCFSLRKDVRKGSSELVNQAHFEWKSEGEWRYLAHILPKGGADRGCVEAG